MNTLTIRDETGQVIGEAYVGSIAVTWRDRTATLRSMLETELQSWITHKEQEIRRAGGNAEAFLDQTVTVRDEYSY